MYRFITKEEFNSYTDIVQNYTVKFFKNNNGTNFLQTFPFGEIINSKYNEGIRIRKDLGINIFSINHVLHTLNTIKKIKEKTQITHKIRNYV